VALSKDRGDVVNRASGVTRMIHILRIRLIAPDSLNVFVQISTDWKKSPWQQLQMSTSTL